MPDLYAMAAPLVDRDDLVLARFQLAGSVQAHHKRLDYLAGQAWPDRLGRCDLGHQHMVAHHDFLFAGHNVQCCGDPHCAGLRVLFVACQAAALNP